MEKKPHPYSLEAVKGRKAGQPPKFKTPEDLQRKVDEYFEWIRGEYIQLPIVNKKGELDTDGDGEPTGRTYEKCVREPEGKTITGLVLYLGFVSRQSLTDYQERIQNKQYADIIRRARLRIENAYEHSLNGTTPTGPIFALKNMGWKDKTEVESNVTANVSMVFKESPNCAPLDDK